MALTLPVLGVQHFEMLDCRFANIRPDFHDRALGFNPTFRKCQQFGRINVLHTFKMSNHRGHLHGCNDIKRAAQCELRPPNGLRLQMKKAIHVIKGEIFEHLSGHG